MMDQPEIEHIGDDLYFVAVSPAMRRLRMQAELLSQTDVPVLITGETDSGKATAARLIHSLSLRSSFQFIRVNCGALTPDLLENELFGSEYLGGNGTVGPSPGKFEQCARGTVLLEALDMMSAQNQDRLLNLLRTRECVRCGGHTPVRVDARVMAAIDTDVEAETLNRTARPDLYDRLSVFQLHVPPLRARREEIPLLLGLFMTRLTRRYGVPAPHFTSALLDACQHYSWPGNLREFENFLKRFLAQGDEEAAIKELASPLGLEARNRKVDASAEGAQHEPHDGRKASLKLLARNAKGEAERQAIQQTLEETHWNRKAAARLLNISYRGLLYKIQQYHLVPPFGNGGASLEPAFRQEK